MRDLYEVLQQKVSQQQALAMEIDVLRKAKEIMDREEKQPTQPLPAPTNSPTQKMGWP